MLTSKSTEVEIVDFIIDTAAFFDDDFYVAGPDGVIPVVEAADRAVGRMVDDREIPEDAQNALRMTVGWSTLASVKWDTEPELAPDHETASTIHTRGYTFARTAAEAWMAGNYYFRPLFGLRKSPHDHRVAILMDQIAEAKAQAIRTKDDNDNAVFLLYRVLVIGELAIRGSLAVEIPPSD